MTDIAESSTRSAHGGNDRRAHVVPGPAEMASWRAFLRAHATITRALETELLAEQDLTLAAYDVLVQLAEAPTRRLRMTELADAVLLSRSGVTRLVDRLEKAGLVRRTRVESDGRGVAAALTPAGLDRLRVASRSHLRGVTTHYVRRLRPDELATLQRICSGLIMEAAPARP